MSSNVGEVVVSKIDGHPYIHRADSHVLVSQGFVDDIGALDGVITLRASNCVLRYRLLGYDLPTDSYDAVLLDEDGE